jgi:peptide-methionine (S)-S-oxide reductase
MNPMNRILTGLATSLSLFGALTGCRAANAENMSGGTSSGAAPTAKAPKVGTEPGHVGQGTPLSPVKAGDELAAFAAGCFWGVEDAFRKVPGVVSTAVGYTGGHTRNPTYPKVCEHDTGHAETVLVEFDPKRLSFEKLVGVFFRMHDPTTLNSQGPDYGDQYRSAIFTFSPAQAATARQVMARAQAKNPDKIVTQISPIGPFYKAEEYHQQYAERTGTHGCPVRGFMGDET